MVKQDVLILTDREQEDYDIRKSVKKLVVDLKAAHNLNVPPIWNGNINQAKQTSFERLSGIEKERFPSAEKLSYAQMRSLVKAMLTFIKVKKNYLKYPERLPLKNVYQLLLDWWNEMLFHQDSGITINSTCPAETRDCNMRPWCDWTVECDESYIASNVDFEYIWKYH